MPAHAIPRKHILADSLEKDIDSLLKKQDAGASYLISQLCYSADHYFRFVERARSRGVTLPIIAGVLPLIKKEGLVRMTLSNGCSIPAEVSALVGRYGANEESLRSAGHAFTVELVRKFLQGGADGIHLYTLNRYEDVADVVSDAGIRPKPAE